MATIQTESPYDKLISQIIQIERQPLLELQQKRGEQERMKGVLSDFDSTLSTLHTQLKSLTDPLSNPFDGRAANVSDTTAFDVSASSSAALGTHSLEVHRLASTDTRVSKQYDSSGTSLYDFFNTNGAQTFSISVAHPTDADPDNRVDINVTVDPDLSTNPSDEEIISEIASAINNAMSDAVEAGTIERTEKASASKVNETSDTARLSISSSNSGYSNRLSFTDSAGGLLAALEVNADVVASGTSGGQVTKVGTSESDSELTSKFTLDGLTMYRNTNKVTDALDGLTIDLKKAGEPAADFSVTADSEGIKDEVNTFIENYNAVLEFIERKANVDGDLNVRGDFAGDYTFTNLRFNMRNDLVQEVAGQPSDGPKSITDLGITINDDGTLSLTDEDELIAAVEKDASAVKSLFASDDGLANRLKDRVDRFLGVNGIIESRQDGLDARLRRMDNRIDRFDDRLASREKQLREQFANLQKVVNQMQGQQQFLGGFLGGSF